VVTITKSITLDCGGGVGGQVGSILADATNGITVNTPSDLSSIVKIRNMTINGLQATGFPGLSGIKFFSGGALIIEHVGIFGFGGTAGSNGGVDFEPSNPAKLAMLDVEVQYGLADGILVKPQSGGSAAVSLTRVSSLINNGSGLRVDTTAITGGTGANVSVVESTFSGNGFGVLAASVNGASAATVMLNRILASGNAAAGVVANGPSSLVRLGSSAVSGNGTGIGAVNSATLSSYNNNQINGNTTDGSASGIISLN
jgi:hypothetical protein